MAWSFNNSYAFRRSAFFSLLELIVVITMAAIMMAVAVSTIEFKPSPKRRLESSMTAFSNFSQQVRWRALETGKDQLILFDPAAKSFSSAFVDEESGLAAEAEPESQYKTLSWILPSEFELDTTMLEVSGSETNNGALEIFRFFPDGGASGVRELLLSGGTNKVKIGVSSLTGVITITTEI